MMEIIVGNKYKTIPGITYMSWDELYSGKSLLRVPYTLITHEGDPSITKEYLHILNDPNLIKWYAINASINHPKLEPIPVGIEYRLRKENENVFREVMDNPLIEKNKLFSESWIAQHTWVEERKRCREALNRNDMQTWNSHSEDYRTYLLELKSSMFCVCPIGNGIDTFRFWECLYMKCVPIIVEYINKEHIKLEMPWYINELPVAKIYKWEHFFKETFTEDLYNTYSFDNEILDFEYWKNKIAT